MTVLSNFIPKKEQPDFREFVALLCKQEGPYLLQNDILLTFYSFCDDHKKSSHFRTKSATFSFIKHIQELIMGDEQMSLQVRRQRARSSFFRLRKDGEKMEELSTVEYLDIKEKTVHGQTDSGAKLRIDMMPFYNYAPSQRDPKNIGNGIRFLNRFMCSKIFQNPEEWNGKLFEFFKLHSIDGMQLLVNGDIIGDFNTFYNTLQEVVNWLRTKKEEIPHGVLQARLKRMGFEPGWGNTAGRILETVELLLDLINEPDDSLFEAFVTRVPMPLISKIAILSPHGWFGQENVLGLPDTGGQVIYILDQVRALERHLREELRLSGLDVQPKILVLTRLIPDAGETTCNLPREKIYNTENAWILRIPFRTEDGSVLQEWVSRFHIWPYLETYADDAETELTSEFQGRPDLIIGNYSDGNLVATLLSDRFNVIQCTIAHALEKTKYLFSDLYWEEREADYHFSLQFTADMLAMNKSDFIITSTYQEIAGTDDTMGQYESYQHFTMPGLFQVVNGINLFAPKFNVIPPGVDEMIYYTHTEEEKRNPTRRAQLEDFIFSAKSDAVFGSLENPEKPPLFTMARFDKIKNITGMIEAFGISKKLQDRFNLIFSAGKLDPEVSQDLEEKEQIRQAHHLIEKYRLAGKFRWLPSIKKIDTGEVYRIMADRKGIFVQPALFEAFGLTVLEAMVCGLPTFATKFGGPSEIITHGENGYLLNTSHPELIAGSLENFLSRMKKDDSLWTTISESGTRHVNEHYNWHIYTERLIRLTRLYGFWRYSVSAKGKVQMDKYCDFIYHFLIKMRAIEGGM